jgi:hypothetical protein
MSQLLHIHRFRFWVRISWASMVLSVITLFFGMMATGGGHGTYGLWFAGLALAAASWLVTLASVVVGYPVIKESTFWGLVWGLQLIIWTLVTLVGAWGLQG